MSLLFVVVQDHLLLGIMFGDKATDYRQSEEVIKIAIKKTPF